MLLYLVVAKQCKVWSRVNYSTRFETRKNKDSTRDGIWNRAGMKFCGSTRASSNRRKMGRDGKGKGKKERERERQLEIEMEREKEEWSCKLWQDLDERRSGKHLCVVRVLTAGTPRHCDVQDARICHVQVTIKTWIFGSRVCLLTMILRFQIASKPGSIFFFNGSHARSGKRYWIKIFDKLDSLYIYVRFGITKVCNVVREQIYLIISESFFFRVRSIKLVSN